MASETALAWERLDAHLALATRLAAGEVVGLEAATIKRVGRREPRLMTKFDTRESRPKLLARATILPVTNGSYVLLPGDGYATVPEAAKLSYWRLPAGAARLGTLPWKAGPSSESQALDMALAAGILEDFLKDPGALLTIRGRLRSPDFEFDFRSPSATHRVGVRGVQIEVDSGLEGRDLHLIEAKLGSRDNFHLRQLYYPFRMWRALAPGRRVTTVLLTWSHRRYRLRRYGFDPELAYHGATLEDAGDYVFDEPEATPDLAQILSRTTLGQPPQAVPFPQADRFERVIDVVDAVAGGSVRQATLAGRYGFTPRQADYYANAALYLGLLTRDGAIFRLTPEGARLTEEPLAARNVRLLACLAQRPVLRGALEHLQQHGRTPRREQLAEWVARATGASASTAARRAGTVAAWTAWAAATLSQLPLRLSPSAERT